MELGPDRKQDKPEFIKAKTVKSYERQFLNY